MRSAPIACLCILPRPVIKHVKFNEKDDSKYCISEDYSCPSLHKSQEISGVCSSPRMQSNRSPVGLPASHPQHNTASRSIHAWGSDTHRTRPAGELQQDHLAMVEVLDQCWINVAHQNYLELARHTTPIAIARLRVSCHINSR